jgi:hypothetical protein
MLANPKDIAIGMSNIIKAKNKTPSNTPGVIMSSFLSVMSAWHILKGIAALLDGRVQYLRFSGAPG